MKIIFDSEEEKEKIINCFADGGDCPSDFWLKDSCARGDGDCKKCWRAALEAIEKKEG